MCSSAPDECLDVSQLTPPGYGPGWGGAGGAGRASASFGDVWQEP